MSSVTRRTPGRDRRAAAEADILAALGRLLADGASFTELGVQQIAEEAGIGRSTFYIHFRDKTDLLIRLAEQSTRELFAVAAGWTDSDEREVLVDTLRVVIEQRREHAPALRALEEVAHYDADVAEAWRRMVGSNVELVRKRVERDQERGLIAADVNAELTASFLTWGTERFVGQHVDAGCDARDGEVAESIARTVWLAMYGRLD